ncbi:class I SAM-dependent DNA methyltransferase [Deinococcus aluminii]|uniref:site-specific DNA-methyltransferase (adenine-specific) n=1 Tax=Deinococcus aluminii TaxID=1656885 RepID=A0ABP9XF39_9DEIO
MQPQDFAQKWRTLAPKLTERAAYQEHWRDLCALLGEPTPSSDLTGEDYAFEKHVKKAGTGETGFADVFKRDHFIVEYKAQGKSLGKALQQALLYARELGNPPLLIVSDLTTIEIHSNFTGSSPRAIRITLDDIERDAPVGGDLTALSALRACFRDPGRLDPRQLRERVTQDATAKIGEVAQALNLRGIPQAQAAHFLMRVVFAMFAEDVGLLPRGLLTRVLKRAREYPDRSQGYFQDLFTAMQHGGEFWGEDVRHFNGGLFDDQAALGITREDADALLAAATLDWANVEPAIFGTLFENSLDAGTRSKRGAHYTAVRDILRLTEPVVMTPLRREWADVKAQADALAGKRGGKTAALEVVQAFHVRLSGMTVLDPSCGSGNFLVVALGQLLDLEQEVRSLGAELGAGPFAMPPLLHPRNLRGIEIEPFAHELASVSVWIAFFQWKAAHGGEWETPVLQRLNTIEQRDALLNPNGTEAAWPAAEFIIGNPPFLGEKRQRSSLGDAYVDQLRLAYKGRVPPTSDLVGYWVEKARTAIDAGRTRRAGLVTTNSLRQPKSLPVLRRVTETGAIFDAWADLPWVQDGAAVRVSIFSFDDGTEAHRAVHHLEGEGTPQEKTHSLEVPTIHADLTAGADLGRAQPLPENAGRSFQGVKLVGPFDLDAATAHSLLTHSNPDGVSNADVVKPYLDGDDVNQRRKDRWVIDFGTLERAEAERYVTPFALVEEKVRPFRQNTRRESTRLRWWRYGEARPAMRTALAPLSRFIVTSEVAKHRIFAWAQPGTVPSGSLVVIAADDDFTFGVLSSRLHALWALRRGQTLEDRPRYTPTTCFDTFPFPHPTTAQKAEVEKWARHLNTVREELLTSDSTATLTGLYNALAALRANRDAAHPVYGLLVAQERLDAAVAAAYGWEWPLGEDSVLARLLALNAERAGA